MSRSNVKLAGVVAALAPLALIAPAERPQVVTVYAWTGGERPERATGFVVAPGRVMTVAHVLDGAVRVEVRPAPARGGGAPGPGRPPARGGGAPGPGRVPARGGAARVVRTDRALDLAVLRVPGATGPRVRFGDHARDLRLLAARAVPAQVRRRVDARLVDQPGRPRRPSLEMAATVLPGDSGAPVVGADGAIVGVVYARSTRRSATAYAIRGTEVRRWSEKEPGEPFVTNRGLLAVE